MTSKWTWAAAALAMAMTAQAQVTPPEVATRQQQELKRGDPPRWFKDNKTTEAQLATLRKEIGAARHEAQAACKSMAGAEKTACMRDAQATYDGDMANLRELLVEANHPRRFDSSGDSGVSEKVEKIEP